MESEDEEEVENALEALLDAQIEAEGDSDGSDDWDEEGEDMEEEAKGSEEADEVKAKKRKREDEENEEPRLSKDPPPSFCLVDTNLDEHTLQERFPLFVEAKKRSGLDVVVRAGEMLYLPTGWFHEVRSLGSGSEGHLAVNYWFHPPDAHSFDIPYSSPFWSKDWEMRDLDRHIQCFNN